LLALHRDAPAEGGAWCGRRDDPDWTLGLKPPPMPAQALFMGDFNINQASPLYARLTGPVSPEYGRMTAISGLVDAYVVAGNAEDQGWTCDTCHAPPRQRIDYCLASAGLAPRIKRAWIDDKAQGSDHQPIWTEIDL
jgi:endonuclease/exonuclease/phosphatase family metal-dependent hydrolase